MDDQARQKLVEERAELERKLKASQRAGTGYGSRVDAIKERLGAIAEALA